MPRAGKLDTGITLTEVEERYRIDLHPIERPLDAGQDYYWGLQPTEIRTLKDRLVGLHEQETVDRVLNRLDCLKYDSGVEPAAQTYEAIIRDEFAIDEAVRNGGEAVREYDCDEAVHRDLYRVSQGFLERTFGAEKNVYRGVRQQSVARFVAKTIDEPSPSEYQFTDSVVSNHTGTIDIARLHSDQLVINWGVDRKYVILAIDQVLDTPCAEDEFHLVGGTIWIEPAGVLHVGSEADSTRPLPETVERMAEPQEMSYAEHRDVANLLYTMYQEGYGPETEDGKRRLKQWFNDPKTKESLQRPKDAAILGHHINYLV